jgi:predicted lipase
LEEFDDRHQTQDLVYGVTKDDIQKRITLVFRGTENKLARKANWLHNLSIAKKDYEVPDAVKHIVDRLRLHSGFGNYMFDTTHDDDDDEDFRKYDEIVEDVKLLLKEHPDYKIYVTGHSLGAALSTVAAFYLTCDPDIPKPVTLLNFASPRVGGKNFLEATRYLEKKRWLRILRVV